MSKTITELEFLIKQNLNNLADIPDNEDLIIKYLIHRHEEGKAYTWVGPVLLAINPRRTNPDLYDHTSWVDSEKLANVSHRAIEPHVFAVAVKARYRLINDIGKVHQAIVISGDSGSGKTFSASKILRFLAATNQPHPSPEYESDKLHSSTLSKIEKACLVLSGFSTATTERNKYSSRHGQFVLLQYRNKSLQGAVINSFLLEQSRVTSGGDNFHIFDQILAGLSESELGNMKLSKNTAYKIVNSVCSITQDRSIVEFKETVEAMNGLGLAEKQRNEIFTFIALLIHLGNIQFKEQVTAGCDVDIQKKDSAEALENACDLMALPSFDLVKLLTTNLISPQSRAQRHSMYYSAITTVEACNMRLHSIIRYLYYRLFNWLVNRLNEILTCREENLKLLGILDIFGFEFFSENSIEQLSINYANERMQLLFMQKYLEAGRSELEGEGLSALPPPPTSCIHERRLVAIESGLFPAFNDACLVGRIDKHIRVNQLSISPKDENKTFIYNGDEKFAVNHYSCLVEYRTADVLRKNTDKVPAELLSTLALCQNKFILSLLANEDERNKIEQREGSRFDKKKNTTLAKLKYSMDGLIKELDKYDLHYIRCIKPVERSDDLKMMRELKQQLASSGILDALPLARCSLSIRLKYDEFSKRYSKCFAIDHEIQDSTYTCKTIMRRVLDEEELQLLVHFGRRLIFFTDAVLDKLELMRDQFRLECASRIQNVWYKYKMKKQFKLVELSSGRVASEYIEVAQQTRPTQQGTSKRCSDKDCEPKTANESRPPPAQRSSDKTTLSTQRSEDRNRSSDFVVYLNNQAFFYKKGFLSRRRLADVPVRFHTRLTCLRESHRLPRSELPRGLEDSL